MPSNPRIIPSYNVDDLISTREKSLAFGLGQPLQYQIPALKFQTLSTFMENLWEQCRKQPVFANVTFSDDYPTDPIASPIVVWRLDSRVAGVDGKNKINPILTETIPTEDGTIIWKFEQMVEFTVTFEILATETADAENIKTNIEFFLKTNPFVPAQCGAKLFYWSSEHGHSQMQVGGSQNLKKRSISYHGRLNEIFAQEVQRIQVVRIWTIKESSRQIHTIPLTRGSLESDSFPIPGPLTIVSIHDASATLGADYIPGIDFVLLSDKEKYGDKFFIVWITQGKNPTTEATYYVSYICANPELTEQKVLTESDTNSVNPTKRPNWQTWRRTTVTPRILGQENSLRGTQRNIITTREIEGLQISEPSRELLEAIASAQIGVVSILDPEVLSGIDPETLPLP